MRFNFVFVCACDMKILRNSNLKSNLEFFLKIRLKLSNC